MAEKTEKQTAPAHGVVNLEDRTRITVSGVRSMGAATPTETTCVTSLGGLRIKGGGLHVVKFSQEEGILILQGKIDAVSYTESQAKQPVWKRMWK